MGIREETMKSEKIYEGKVLNLRVDTVELGNKGYSKREIVEKPAAVAVIAVNEEDQVLLVKQYRKAVEDFTLELPAGLVEVSESPKESAYRELLEETGYRAKDMSYILEFYSSAGYSDEIIYLFYTNEIEKISDDLGVDDEDLELLALDWNELMTMIESGKILDSKTLIALLYADKYLRGRD